MNFKEKKEFTQYDYDHPVEYFSSTLKSILKMHNVDKIKSIVKEKLDNYESWRRRFYNENK